MISDDRRGIPLPVSGDVCVASSLAGSGERDNMGEK